jgi:UDP-GlcNAc3NAcA epimerase
MRILTIVGARPQFIKAAAVSREFATRPSIEEIIVHTGQHYDQNMSAVFFEEMGIPVPRFQLSVHGLSHGAMTGQMLEQLEEILLKVAPDYVLVYGDTNTTLAGALAAIKLHVPVAHVEAGLRSSNLNMPEEINRIITDRISSLLCCPTQVAVENLRREGFEGFQCCIELTGDVMQDAAEYYTRLSSSRSTVIARLNLANDSFALCTLHRAENTESKERLADLCSALDNVLHDMRVILPLHPRTKAAMERFHLTTNATIIDPVGYFDMLELLKHCRLVLTDSGGLQKEAFFFKRPCVTLREETEWQELVSLGFNTLAGTDPVRVAAGVSKMLAARPNFALDLYGGGRACGRIADLLEHLNA